MSGPRAWPAARRPVIAGLGITDVGPVAPKVFTLRVGGYDSPVEEVQPGFPSACPTIPSTRSAIPSTRSVPSGRSASQLARAPIPPLTSTSPLPSTSVSAPRAES